MSNIVAGLALTGSLLTLTAEVAQQSQGEEPSVGDELANTMLLEGFLQMTDEELIEFSDTLITRGEDLRYVELNCPDAFGVEDDRKKAVIFIRHLQRECKKASKRRGVQGVLDVLKKNGLKVSVEVEKESPIDLAYCIHKQSKWDWSPLFKIAATSAVMITVYLLGAKIVTTLNQRNREIEQLKTEITQVREENSYLYQFAPDNLGEYAGEVLLP